MRNFIQDGEVLTVTAPYTTTSGQGVKVGDIFGIAVGDIASGASGAIQTVGVFDVTKQGGAGVTFSAGDKVYWDDGNRRALASGASGNMWIGVATAAAADGDTTVRVAVSSSRGPRFSQSAEQTGTGSSQNVAHNLGKVPNFVIVYPTDTAPATTGVYTMTEGTHTTTNVVVTVTSGKKFKVLAIG